MEKFIQYAPQILGAVGFSLYAVIDILQSLKRIPGDGIAYYAGCSVSVFLVGIGLVFGFNLSLLLVELFLLATCMLVVFFGVRVKSRSTSRTKAQSLAEVRFP